MYHAVDYGPFVKFLEIRLTSTVTSSCTHLINIFGIDISLFLDQVFHCVHMTSFSCHVQGSSLVKRNNVHNQKHCTSSYKIIQNKSDNYLLTSSLHFIQCCLQS